MNWHTLPIERFEIYCETVNEFVADSFNDFDEADDSLERLRREFPSNVYSLVAWCSA